MTPPVPVDAEHLPELLDDLDQAAAALLEVVADESHWTLRPASGWSIGQHVEHVARSLALTAQGFERAADALARDQLPKRPWRDPLQAVFVKVVTGRRFPRGGRSPAPSRPDPTPDRARALYDVTEGASRHRRIADHLQPAARERVWIWNPFVPRFKWHYTLPEIVRVQANHTRHHMLQITEIKERAAVQDNPA
jgi:hypothetical protein